jgi:hypothetical protein
MFTVDSRKFQPFQFANEPVTLKRRVLGFLSYFTRIGYNSINYEYYFSMDNYVEAGCTICDMVLGGLPREEYEKSLRENSVPEYCKSCDPVNGYRGGE